MKKRVVQIFSADCPACCAGRGPDEAALRSAGSGQPIP